MSKRMAAKVTQIKRGRYLIHNTGTELMLVGGPYLTQERFGGDLVAYVREYKDQDDTMHIMTVGAKGIGFSEFSGRFMEAVETLAHPAGASEDELGRASEEVYG
jgi:hypothetical protein